MTTLNTHQPEASTSTFIPTPKHHVSLVICSALAREQYLRLVEANGIVHSLVQRLIEKHGGDKNLLFRSQVITNGQQHAEDATTKQVNSAGFQPASTFLSSLPAIAPCLSLSVDDTVSWHSFIDPSKSLPPLLSESHQSKERRRETCLLDGIVQGVELLTRNRKRKPRGANCGRFLQSISPPEALPLLSTTFHTPPSRHRDSQYLIILTGTATPEGSIKSPSASGDDWVVVPKQNEDKEWDKKSWREIGSGCRSNGVHASCIIAGQEDTDSALSRSLRKLCQETSPNGFEEPWFDLPEDTDVAISGFGLDPGTVPPSPSAQAVSSAPTEQIITPATNASESVPAHISAAKAQLQQQQIMAFKMITARANASGNPLSQEAMNQLVSAMRSGNLDINAPGMQQIKTLLSLQQQQKQGQAAMNPGAAAVAAAQSQASGQNHNPSNDQILMAAMRQQMGQQNQGVAQPQQNTQPQAVQSQSNQQRPQPAPQAQNQRSQQAPVWSGELVWTPSSGTRFVLSLNANVVGGGQVTDYRADLWSKELIINTVTGHSVQALQAYSKAVGAPFVLFIPQGTQNGDQSNLVRYSNMAKSLHNGGQVAVINFSPDRGLVVFANMGPAEVRPERLMALVCLNAPLPPALRPQQQQNNQANGQAQVQAQIQARPQATQNISNGENNANPSISPSYPQQQQQLQQSQYVPNTNQFSQHQQAQQLAQQQQQQQQQRMSVPPQQQQQQQQQVPSRPQQFMLTAEQNAIFRRLAVQYKLNIDFDPFNLDENKYTQIVTLINQAMAQHQQRQQQQQMPDTQGGYQQPQQQQQQQQQFGGLNGNGYQGNGGQGYQQ